MNTQSDDFLLLRWHGHRDAHAFREIARRYAPMVFATCRRILHNASEAEDLTQECFLFLAQQTASPPECVPAWLHVVAVRRSLTRLRALGRRAALERRYAEEQTHSLEPGPSEFLHEVDEALAELPESLRVPLVLHFLEQRSQDEIATQFGVAQSTISRRLDKGIAELRSRLEQKRVFVSAAALASGLQAEAQVTLSASVSAALGKISLAGSSASVAATTSISAAQIAALGGGIVMKKLLITSIGIAALALAVFWSLQKDAAQQPLTSEVMLHETVSENAISHTKDMASTATALPASDAVKPQTDVDETTENTEGSGVIEGHVFDAVTSEGIPGVVVTAKWGNEGGPAGEFGEVESDPTNADGTYPGNLTMSGIRGSLRVLSI